MLSVSVRPVASGGEHLAGKGALALVRLLLFLLHLVKSRFILLDLLLQVRLSTLNALELVVHFILVFFLLAQVVARAECHAVRFELLLGTETHPGVSHVIHLMVGQHVQIRERWLALRMFILVHVDLQVHLGGVEGVRGIAEGVGLSVESKFLQGAGPSVLRSLQAGVGKELV